ncbi:hypothetical protein [Rhizobium sp. Root1220]|uniref:hypothetical protein n=1 Tax=Rhizobium sp. Root1220 TaxID=1736432 RepID=UPI0006FC9E87|nr:hypothetical protein [Rhizobium sp. Root1220]KQV82845.1 hypothetical protein ASC90_22415 [Rhizobium sp. Root1220]
MDSAVVLTGDRQSATRSFSLLRTVLIIYCTALAMVLFDVADGILFVGDIDDQMRELQIRYLLSPHGRWFDLSLPFIATPDTYVSPWSRLVDLPYVLIVKLLSPFLSLEASLPLSFLIWPPMMLAIFCFLVASTVHGLIARHAFTQLAYTLLLMLITMLMSIGVLEFAPGRVDHHNAQIIAMMMTVAGLVRWDRVGGLMMGAGAGVSTVIGLESLPFVTIAYAGLIACYVAGVAKARDLIVSASAAMIGVILFSALAFVGPTGAISTQCDAFSAPYIFLAVAFSVVLSVCALINDDHGKPLHKALWLALPASGVCWGAAVLFPSCLAGPYGIIDPLSRELWFARIWQERSIFYFYQNGQYDLLALIALTTGLLVLAFPAIVAKAKGGSVGPAIGFAVVAGALVLTVFITRNIRFPIALAPVFLPLAVASMIHSRRASKRAVFAAVSVLAGLFGLWFAIPVGQHEFDAVDYMAASDCAGQDFSVLAAARPGRIAAPQGIALPVLFAARDGFSVGAVPFHRAAPGMKRMFEAFRSPDPAIRRQALEPFDYVAVCRFPLQVDPKEAPLYAALAAGQSWPGLTRIDPPGKSNFQLFRIDHTQLR